ncbi:MAG: M50 family metallopeptidase [Ruminococcus sp.]|nr:M50 family metallopeptidase [Ruminococcus sp.]
MGFYGACIVHELGHIFAVYLTGGEILSIQFSWTGIKMTAAPPKSAKSAIFVQLCGPLANLLAFLLLLAGGKTGYFAIFCLTEGLLNLLPYKFLDGGTILELLAEISPNEKKCRIFNNFLRIIVFLMFTIYLFNELNKRNLNLFIY